MAHFGNSRCSLSFAQICALILGLAVFLWGTGYKLSLYFPQSQFHTRIPTPKLFSPDENPLGSARVGCANAFAKIATPPLAFSFALMTSANVSLPARPFQREDQRSRYVSPLRSASFIYFAFRPPPASISPLPSI